MVRTSVFTVYGHRGYVTFAMGTIIFKALVLVKSLPLLFTIK
jgi:hypothetical protein